MIFWIILISVCSAQLTHALVKHYHWTSVRTSALTSLVFCYCLKLMHVPEHETLGAAFLGASFLGMADSEMFRERDLFFGAWIFALIFQFILPYNIGLGGALGLAAFVTCGIIRGSCLLAGKLRLSSSKTQKEQSQPTNIQT